MKWNCTFCNKIYWRPRYNSWRSHCRFRKIWLESKWKICTDRSTKPKLSWSIFCRCCRSCCICNIYPCHPASWPGSSNFTVCGIFTVTGNRDTFSSIRETCREYQKSHWISSQPSKSCKSKPSIPSGSSGSCTLWALFPKWWRQHFYIWDQRWSGRGIPLYR